jgi:hypothetical protein
LLGYLDQGRALVHLRADCVPDPPNASDDELTALWRGAQAKLGAAFPNAGNAEVLPIPRSEDAYLQRLVQEAWVQQGLKELALLQAMYNAPPPTFQLVEIDPILACHFTVDIDRTGYHCGRLTGVSTLSDLMEICLPTAQPTETYYQSPVSPTSESLIIKLRNHDLSLSQWGVFDAGLGVKIAGASFRLSLPFVHVVRWNGRCFLYNGYHRAYGIRLSGTTHVPCIFRDVGSAEAVGIRRDGGTFPEAVLMSDNPPTIGHFSGGRAHPVALRMKSRVIQVSWHQYSVPDE